VWGTEKGGNLNSAEKKSLGSKTGKGAFSATVTAAMAKGETQYVRAYAKGNGYLVYGKEVSFVSLGSQAPVIEGFSPGTGTWGDTIQITGAGFSFLQRNNKVNFGDSPAKVLAATDSVIICMVPDSIVEISVKISVTVAGNASVAENSFQLITPEVTGFHPAKGTFGDIITITGSDFRPGSRVKFSGYDAEVISTTPHEIKVKVPDELDQSVAKIKVILNAQEYETNDSFHLLPPEITSLGSPAEYIGNTITVSGNNFSPVATNNKVFFEENEAVVVNASVNELQVEVPDGGYSQRTCKITVKVAGQNTTSHDEFELADAWYKKKTENKSLIERGYWSGVVLDNNGYFIPHGNNFSYNEFKKYLLVYKPDENVLNPIIEVPVFKDYPITIGFQINNKLYFGYGGSYLDFGFWEYDKANNKWSPTTTYPEDIRILSYFSINNKGYIGFGSRDKRFWEFDPQFNKYIQKANYAGSQAGFSFSINNKGYVGSSSELWQYDTEKDQWVQRSPIPETIYVGNNSVFVMDDKAYVVHGETIYQYNPNEDSWTSYYGPDVSYHSVPLVIGNYVYFIGHNGNMWELDPDRLRLQQ